jgi:hypothetical protein
LFKYLFIASPERREKKEKINLIGGVLPFFSLFSSFQKIKEKKVPIGRTPISKENKYSSRRGVVRLLLGSIKAPFLLGKCKWGGGRRVSGP